MNMFAMRVIEAELAKLQKSIRFVFLSQETDLYARGPIISNKEKK